MSKRALPRPLAGPDPSDAKNALINLVSKNTKAEQSRATYLDTIASKDVRELQRLIQEDRELLEACRPEYLLCSEGYDLGGWECRREDLTFSKVFVLSNDHMYKLEGSFILSPSTKTWDAEVCRFVFLLNHDQISEFMTHETWPSLSIQIIPTEDEAKKALIQWLRSNDLRKSLSLCEPDESVTRPAILPPSGRSPASLVRYR